MSSPEPLEQSSIGGVDAHPVLLCPGCGCYCHDDTEPDALYATYPDGSVEYAEGADVDFEERRIYLPAGWSTLTHGFCGVEVALPVGWVADLPPQPQFREQ